VDLLFLGHRNARIALNMLAPFIGGINIPPGPKPGGTERFTPFPSNFRPIQGQDKQR
jgi:hypothetical protein